MMPTPNVSKDRTVLTLTMLYEKTGSPHVLRLLNQAQAMREMGSDL